MKLIKYLIITVVVLILLLVAGAGILVATVDPNDYKDDIIKLVKESTGRTLTLEGDLGFTFFPALGVSLGEAQLSNASGFGDQPFAQVSQVILPDCRQKAELIQHAWQVFAFQPSSGS